MDKELKYITDKLDYNFKPLKNGVEIRTRGDLNIAILQARQIIANQKLNLKVNSTGDMASRGAFEILLTHADQSA